MDVPLRDCEALSDVNHVETMLLPGAQMSTQLPKLLKSDRASSEVVEPTVMAEGTKAGENLQALLLPLPTATTTTTPACTATSTASSMATSLPPPPKLMLATAGRSPFVAS